MASSASSRPVREGGSSSAVQRRKRVQTPRSSSSEESEADPSDIARLRQKRASYYTKPPAERAREARPLAQESRRKTETDRVRRAPMANGTTATVHRVGSRASVTHRRRRKRRSKDEEQGKGGDYVYRTVTTTTIAKRQPTVTERIISSSRVSLGLPQRSTSQRTTRTSNEPLTRRHSYHGDVRPKRTREPPAERSAPKR
jgi:hypothetical protein